MKKTLIKATLLCALTFSMPFAFNSCKDYDGDVTRLDNQDAAFTTQITALQTALTDANTQIANAKSDAAAAIAAANAAKTAADAAAQAAAEAKAQAALAAQAAAQAKADAITEAMAQVKALLADYAKSSDVAAQMAALGSRIDGIEKGLSTFATKDDLQSAITTMQEALKIQSQALETYKQLIATQMATLATKDEVTASIAGLQAQITAILNNLSNYATAADIQAAVTDLNTKISAQINTSVSTLSGVLAKRLTSVTLIPEYYIDGIPSIVFNSASYVPQGFNSNWVLNPISGASNIIVANTDTKAKFRLNPAGIGANDIVMDQVAFVCDIAETRSTVNSPITPSGAGFTDGQFWVEVTKNPSYTGSLNLANSKINIASLRVPIAPKNYLQNETPADAMVYSEYIRVAETEFAPSIAEVANIQKNFYAHADVYTAEAATNVSFADVVYTTPYNLASKVTGAMTINGQGEKKAISVDKLKTYGLAFRFAIPTTGAGKEYIVGDNGTNQQTFAKITDNGILTPQLPDGTTGAAAAPAVGKAPIVWVSLMDTVHNKVVDARFIKVMISKQASTPIDLGVIKSYTATLSPNSVEGAYLWEDMTNTVYKAVGMNKADFNKVYTQFAFNGTGTVENNSDTATPSGTNALTWTLTPEQIGTILPEMSKDFYVTITFSDPNGLHPDVTFKFKATINMPALPTLVNKNLSVWDTDLIFPVLPMKFYPPYNASETCEYNNNLWLGFMGQPTSLVNGLLTSTASLNNGSAWDIEFSSTQPTGYSSDVTSKVIGGHNLAKGGTTAAVLDFGGKYEQWVSNPVSGYPTAMLKNNSVGIALLNKIGATTDLKLVNVTVWARINAWNAYEVASYQLKFQEPLKIKTNVSTGEVVDKGTIPSTLALGEAFTMVDNYGNKVGANSIAPTQVPTPSQLMGFYVVNTPTWDIANAVVGLDATGTPIDNPDPATNCIPYKQANIELSVNNGTLTYSNNGATLTKTYYLFIKATMGHKWGVAQDWVKIKVVPGTVTRNRK